ncbi:MAG: capsule assembly Wzi family protein, partial [candidate division KSB1 bacterium]|nr:capsule assembly Wzi family protein [candidate division KSB1 bacterium]
MKKYVLSFFLLLVGYLRHSYAQSVNLPFDHWAYDFIERLETRGLFTRIDAGSKPYSRQEIGHILYQVDQTVLLNETSLSPAEKGMLEQLKGEFCEELLNYQIAIQPRYQERHLMSWQEDENKVLIDFYFDQRVRLKKIEPPDTIRRLSETTLGGLMRGYFKPNLAFNIDVRNTLMRGTDIREERVSPSEGLPIIISGKNVYSDQATAYFTSRWRWLQLEVGRDQAKWGPGYHGGLILSQNNPVFDLIKLQTRRQRFNFIYFHGFLNSLERKYLVAHRLEFKAQPWLYLGTSETVVYGHRGLEFLYLIPIMPYLVAQHQLGNKDKALVNFDLSAYFRQAKFYCEWLLDDFKFSSTENKFAWLIGTFWVDPLGLKNLDLRVEYARLEPLVYTHQDSINRYQNYNQVMGYWTGPDSDNLFFEANYFFNKGVRLRLNWEQVGKGEGIVGRQQIYSFQ